jgi:hypothetical protein
MKALFVSAAAVFAAVPGLGVIASGLGTPPGTEYRLLFGGVIEGFGALALIILWVNQKKLQRKAKRKITRAAIILGIASFVFISAYVMLFRYTVVTIDKGQAYYPIWLTGDVQRRVDRAGSRAAAIDRYGPAPVNEDIDKMGTTPLAVTSIILLLLYQGIFTSLTLAFGLVGFHMGVPLFRNEANPPPTQLNPDTAQT